MDNKPQVKDNTSSTGDGLHVTFDPRAKPPLAKPSKSSPTLSSEGDAEKFPAFMPSQRSGQKSRSLTQAEINMGIIGDDEVAALGERLQNEPAPLSLQQARERRASIKEERKRSIDFIRSRTNSRAAAQGRPSMEVAESGAAASGRPSLEVLMEAQQKE
ncbi:hypothetical protein N431DRAFT_403687 [Stipitochalara longipes BDJ]|nr:hypothetical protein N431DRAFT_403687 [Stipitochalara longipes BDJ]